MSSKRVILFVSAISLLAVIGCAIRPMPGYEKDPPLPQISGEIEVPGLRGEARIYRDQWGVPHIYADDPRDLFFADGYVQAQDRLWEITLFRAVASGRLSEIFGNVGVPGAEIMGMKLSTFEMDKRARVFGMKFIGEIGQALLAETQPELLGKLQAYCDGLNAYVDRNRGNLPIEFRILNFEPDRFSPADVIALSRFYGSMLSGNLDDELARYAIALKMGAPAAWELMPLHESLGPTIVPTRMLKNRLDKPRELPLEAPPDLSLSAEAAFMLARTDRAMRIAAGFPSRWASNNWVIGPKMTETGAAMLANDPHLVHIQPSLSYVIHLAGAGYDAYGVAFPGNPYVVMGHTRDLSWAATVTGADVMDLFVETTDDDHPGQYLHKGEWRDFTVRKEVIKIRPGKVQLGRDKRFRKKTIEVRHTVHGPVINDVVSGLPDDAPLLALRWVGWDFSRDPDFYKTFIHCPTVDEFMVKVREIGPENLDVINVGMMFDLWNRGRGIDDFIEGLSYNVLLNMNWLAADSKGHIAYLPGGLVPIRKKGIGAMPAPGASGEYDWSGFIPLMEHPHAIDPERGWMATANNQVVERQYYPYVFATNYSPGWRAWRIEELIEELAPIDVSDMRRIQNDVYVKSADVFVPLILAAVEEKGASNDRVEEAARLLSRWNREATIDSAGAAIFYETMSRLTERVLKDDFDKDEYELVREHAGGAVQMWLIKGESAYFDDKGTRGRIEDRYDVLVGALEDAVKWLSKELGRDPALWQWGKIHTIKWYHPMGFGPLKEMSIGPYPHPGGNDTVRNASSLGIGPGKHQCFGGPVMRHIIDMGDPHNALLVIDGSESGVWLSPHYRDMHTLWYNSQYMRAEKRKERIVEDAEALLILKPGG